MVVSTALASDELLNAQALQRILYPLHTHNDAQLEICANLLRYGSFRNKVTADNFGCDKIDSPNFIISN